MSWNAPTRLIFPPWVDKAALVLVLGVAFGAAYVPLVVAFGSSDKTLATGYAPEQPVPYSHKVHVGQLGLDCVYCHTSVEHTAKANIPPTQTCMNCHSKVLTQSPKLEPLRRSMKTGLSVEWVRVHDLPDYVFFNHSAHVSRGIGCESCHGRVDTMDVVYQTQSLSMSWCVDCHRHPEKNLRPPRFATVMGWQPPRKKDGSEWNRSEYGQMLMKKNNINPPTDCSTCHR